MVYFRIEIPQGFVRLFDEQEVTSFFVETTIIHIYVYIHVYDYMYVYKYIYVYIFTYVCIHMYVYLNTYIRVSV